MGNNHKGIAAGGAAAKQYKTNCEVKYKTFNKPLDIPEPRFSIKSIEKSLEKIEKKNYGGTLWEYGIIPFEISEDIETNCPELQKLILDAVELCNKSLRNVYWIPISTWRMMLCTKSSLQPSITFVTADKGRGPSSKVGCYGVSGQKIRVCLYFPSGSKIKIGNILHEMTHAMGFTHEHQRTDRDEYVDIDEEYKDARNYVKKGVTIGRYDFKSIMHYKLSTKGRVNEKYSDKATNIGQRDRYSLFDKIGINEMYKNEREKALAIDHGFQTNLTNHSCEFMRMYYGRVNEIVLLKTCSIWFIHNVRQTYGHFKIISVESNYEHVSAKSSFKRTLRIRYLHHPNGW